ncbi:hypothetical protein ACXNSR_31310 [Streptomyces sp. NC-S4]
MRAAARPDLAAVRRRTWDPAQECGRDPAEVLAVERRVHQRFLRLRATRRDKHGRDGLERLSYLTGMTPQDIRLPLKEQVHLRFEHLRRTRVREYGQRHSPATVAGSFDASGQSPTRLARGEGVPNLAAAAGVQRFHGVEGGLLPPDGTEALAGALALGQGELESTVRDRRNPMPAVLRTHDVRSTVTRAGRLSPRGWKSPADHLDDLLAREGQLGIPGTKGGAPIEGIPTEGEAP